MNNLFTLSAVAVVVTLPARAAEPRVGTVQTLPVASVVLEVGSTGEETKRVTYAPPPGWYVRSHRVDCGRRYGRSSYAVSTIPTGWRWEADTSATETGRAKAAVSGGTHTVRYGGEAEAERDAATASRRRERVSHHALVVDVTARGAGLWQGGGGIELTVYAELVYVGGK